MITKNELAAAARFNDAEAEEHSAREGGEGFPFVISKLDIDTDDLIYVAEQRALRLVILARGEDPEKIDWTAQQTFSLTSQEKELQGLLTLVWMDGVATHARAAQLAE